MQLDHVTIVTADCDALERFFVDIAGTDARAHGRRFRSAATGCIADGRPVVHLIDASACRTRCTAGRRRASTISRSGWTSAAEWQALARAPACARHRLSTRAKCRDGPQSRSNCSCALAPGVVVEFVTALPITLNLKSGVEKCPFHLLALAISAFAIGTTEFVIMGLLPEVARDLAVSIPSAGLLVSGYALGVAVGAPLLAVLTSKMPRKLALQLLMGVFIVGNMLCAVAPSYCLLMIARVVTSFAHGSFFGIGAVVAASLVPAEKRASAIALMFTGLTLANVLGVPFGTFVGQEFGWRATFWIVAALGVLSLARRDGARAESPRCRPGRPRSRSARAEGPASLDSRSR